MDKYTKQTIDYLRKHGVSDHDIDAIIPMEWRQDNMTDDIEKKAWIVKCWLNLPDVEDETHYDSYEKAFEARNELEAMQPENKYEVEEIVLHEEEESDLGSWLLYATDEIRTAQTQKEQNEIIRQLCGLKSFRDFIKESYYIVHDLRDDNKIKVRERVFPKSLLDDSKPDNIVEHFIRDRQKIILEGASFVRDFPRICPVCSCPDYDYVVLKAESMRQDAHIPSIPFKKDNYQKVEKIMMKICKNCSVVRF